VFSNRISAQQNSHIEKSRPETGAENCEAASQEYKIFRDGDAVMARQPAEWSRILPRDRRRPKMATLVRWGAWIRTREWRNQNPTIFFA
jgi:hypothetical protein